MSNKQPIAVFDIDGTVFRSSLLIELVEQLTASGLFPKKTGEAYEEEQFNWLNRKGGYEPYINKVVEVFYTQLKGASYQKVANIAGEIIEKKYGYVYRYTRSLIKEMKAKGYFILGISHSPKFIVDGFGYENDFDKVYGIFYEIGPSGNFTGEVNDKDLIFNKAAILQRAIRKEKLTFERSVGVGDSESDIPMLEMVETPIAFNPNKKLFDHAKRRVWKIVIERKDVIYEI